MLTICNLPYYLIGRHSCTQLLYRCVGATLSIACINPRIVFDSDSDLVVLSVNIVGYFFSVFSDLVVLSMNIVRFFFSVFSQIFYSLLRW